MFFFLDQDIWRGYKEMKDIVKNAYFLCKQGVLFIVGIFFNILFAVHSSSTRVHLNAFSDERTKNRLTLQFNCKKIEKKPNVKLQITHNLISVAH